MHRQDEPQQNGVTQKNGVTGKKLRDSYPWAWREWTTAAKYGRRAVVAASVAICCLLHLSAASIARAATLPPPLMDITLPDPGNNAFIVSTRFNPGDGLMYVWNGTAILKQNAVNSSSFTPLATGISPSADAGPINFSRDGSQILVGNGAGGISGGANNGPVFSVPLGGGSGTQIGDVDFHTDIVPVPAASTMPTSAGKYFVYASNDASGSASSISVLDAASMSNTPLIGNIPGASAAIAVDAMDRLYVVVGYGAARGQIRRFSLSALDDAFNTSTPLNWTAGELFNSLDVTSGAGMFFDIRGNLFAGGPNGVTVFDTSGAATLWDNGGFTIIDYNPVTDQMLVYGFGTYAGMYDASTLLVPEPPAWALMMIAGVTTIALAIRRRRLVSRKAQG